MSKEELITKQQLEIERYKATRRENEDALSDIRLMFFAIGQPLNDNRLRFNPEQLKWCSTVFNMLDSIDTEDYSK